VTKFEGGKMERLTPQKVQEMLASRGTIITIEQAAAILEFLRKLANIAVSNYLQK
jgi:hypothetical protein